MTAVKDDWLTFYAITGANFVSRFIRGGEMGFPYSHVGCRLKDGRLISAHWQDGLCIRTEADEGAWRRWAWIRIPVTTLEREDAEQWLIDQVDLKRRYDLGAIAGMVARVFSATPGLSHWPTKWICSSAQVQACREIGVFPKVLPIPVSETTPRDFVMMLMGVPGAEYEIRKPERAAPPYWEFLA